MIDLAEDPVPISPHVPARQVFLSATALWLCYFVLITVRGLVVELGEFGDLLWRRALVTLAGIAVTMLAWPLLRRFDGRPIAVRVAAALVIMQPAALLLAMVNQQAFAPVEARLIERLSQQAPPSRGEANAPHLPAPRPLQLPHDDAGNVLIDSEDPEPAASASGAIPAAAALPSLTLIQDPIEQEGLWRQLTDVALGRYFLLIAWAALYLALGNAEMVRVAERREGEYRRAVKAAELRSLRYQVNPHFLFNTLNSLSTLVLTGRSGEAEQMIQAMSSFYRHSLAADPTADLALGDEIALQQHYLDIETVRFPDRLRTRIDVPDDLREARVPGMILQPLVENSIRYAVAATRHPVTISIVAREEEGKLVVTVADDGPGKAGPSGGTGIGLANVRARLAARFGPAARFDSGVRPEGGYASTLIIPLPSLPPSENRRRCAR